MDQDSIYYSYNASSIRTSKTVNGATTNYVLNGSNVIRETKGNIVINYYYDSNNDVIGFTYNNQKYLYLKNLQNDVIGIIDNNDSIIVKYYYDGYGNIISAIDNSGINLSSINPFRYRSYYYDNETGWYYLNNRYYDPLIKRFITPDDINYLGVSGSALGYNLYSYCENNPINSIDICGNSPYQLFESIDEAAIDFAILCNERSITNNVEYASAIDQCVVTKLRLVAKTTVKRIFGMLIPFTSVITVFDYKFYYYYSLPLRGTNKSSIPTYRLSTVATIHTHAVYDPKYGKGNDEFSDADKRWANFLNLILYMVNPNGELWKYYPNTFFAPFKIEGIYPRDPNHP